MPAKRGALRVSAGRGSPGPPGPATKTTELPSVELYVPEIVQIAFSSIHEDEDFPLCYYQDYVVRWNPDSDNSNGIIICVKWIGLMVYGDDYPSTYVQHYICVPDNGFGRRHV